MEVDRVILWALSVFVALVSERFVVLAHFSQSSDSDFTFTLPAGRKECFYQTMKKDASLEIEYQVIKTHIIWIILCKTVTSNCNLPKSDHVDCPFLLFTFSMCYGSRLQMTLMQTTYKSHWQTAVLNQNIICARVMRLTHLDFHILLNLLCQLLCSLV